MINHGSQMMNWYRVSNITEEYYNTQKVLKTFYSYFIAEQYYISAMKNTSCKYESFLFKYGLCISMKSVHTFTYIVDHIKIIQYMRV